jgi:hypothetical protein
MLCYVIGAGVAVYVAIEANGQLRAVQNRIATANGQPWRRLDASLCYRGLRGRRSDRMRLNEQTGVSERFSDLRLLVGATGSGWRTSPV